MRALLERYGGRDSLGLLRPAPRQERRLVTVGKAAIAYRVFDGVMLASGDPIGDPEAWPGAIQAFLQVAGARLDPGRHRVQRARRHRLPARAGLSALELGDEAVVELGEFLAGRPRDARCAAGLHAGGAGRLHAARCAARETSAPTSSPSCARAAAWRGRRTERGFSMALAPFGDPRTRLRRRSSARRSRAGAARLPALRPVGDRRPLSRPDAPRPHDDNGLNEFLIVSACGQPPSSASTRISLNFAVFRYAIERGERLGAGPVQRAWRWVLVFLSRWFQIDSLYRFNAKFRPIWEPRFVCYPGGARPAHGSASRCWRPRPSSSGRSRACGAPTRWSRSRAPRRRPKWAPQRGRRNGGVVVGAS